MDLDNIPAHCLSIMARVPRNIKDNNSIRSNQIDTKATSSEKQKTYVKPNLDLACEQVVFLYVGKM